MKRATCRLVAFFTRMEVLTVAAFLGSMCVPFVSMALADPTSYCEHSRVTTCCCGSTAVNKVVCATLKNLEGCAPWGGVRVNLACFPPGSHPPYTTPCPALNPKKPYLIDVTPFYGIATSKNNDLMSMWLWCRGPEEPDGSIWNLEYGINGPCGGSHMHSQFSCTNALTFNIDPNSCGGCGPGASIKVTVDLQNACP